MRGGEILKGPGILGRGTLGEQGLSMGLMEGDEISVMGDQSLVGDRLRMGVQEETGELGLNETRAWGPSTFPVTATSLLLTEEEKIARGMLRQEDVKEQAEGR